MCAIRSNEVWGGDSFSPSAEGVSDYIWGSNKFKSCSEWNTECTGLTLLLRVNWSVWSCKSYSTRCNATKAKTHSAIWNGKCLEVIEEPGTYIGWELLLEHCELRGLWGQCGVACHQVNSGECVDNWQQSALFSTYNVTISHKQGKYQHLSLLFVRTPIVRTGYFCK